MDRAPLVDAPAPTADRRLRLLPGSPRCACRWSL